MREGDERNSASVSTRYRKQIRIAKHFERGATLPAVPSFLARTSPAFQRVGRRARQMPRYACSIVFELNRTIDGLLRHRLHDRSAETPPIRRSYRRAVALSPVHLEETVGTPSDVDVAGIR